MKTDTGCLETKNQVAMQRAIKKGKKKKKEVGGKESFPILEIWPGYPNEQIWWEFFLELTFVKSIQVCVYFISNIWLPTQWCHVQLRAKKSMNAPSKSYTLN